LRLRVQWDAKRATVTGDHRETRRHAGGVNQPNAGGAAESGAHRQTNCHTRVSGGSVSRHSIDFTAAKLGRNATASQMVIAERKNHKDAAAPTRIWSLVKSRAST
jgi:hypothetical protein